MNSPFQPVLPPRPTDRPTRAVLRAAIGWPAALALLAWLLRDVRWREVGGALGRAPAWAWPLAAAGLAASYGLRALRIHAELSRRQPVTRRACLRVMLLHNAAVNLLPLRSGEAAYPALAHRVLRIPLGQAVASLVWIRAQDAIILGLLALALAPGLAPWQRALAGAAVLGAVLVGIAAVQRWSARSEGGGEGSRLQRAAIAALSALAEAPRHGIAGWLYGAGSWVVKLAAIGFLLARLSGLAGLDAAGGALGGELAGVLPLQGPAGFGTYEGGVWAGASLSGGPGLAVAAPAIAVHLFSLAVALSAAAVAQLTARLRPAAPPAAPARPAESPHA